MAGKQSNDDGMINDINITPMVDIMLVLLIIFMVTASIIVTPSIPVKLPSAATGEEAKTKTIPIVITKDNKFFVEGKIISNDKLEKFLKDKKEELDAGVIPENNTNEEQEGDENIEVKPEKVSLQIVIAADKEAYHGKVMAVVDILRKIGISDYAFSVEDK